MTSPGSSAGTQIVKRADWCVVFSSDFSISGKPISKILKIMETLELLHLVLCELVDTVAGLTLKIGSEWDWSRGYITVWCAA